MKMNEKTALKKCPRQYVLAINDTLNVVSGNYLLLRLYCMGKRDIKIFRKILAK